MNRGKPGKKKQRGLLNTLCQRTTSTYSGILFITANNVGSLVELQSEVLVRIQLPGDSDQHMSKVGVDAPIPFFVGIGQRASRNSAPDPCVIKLGLHGPQACFDVAKTLPIGQLSEGHAKELIETRKDSNPVLALIPANAFVEFVSRKKAH